MLTAAVLHDPDLIVYKRFLQYAKEELFEENFCLILSTDTPYSEYAKRLPRVVNQPLVGIADARRHALREFLTDDLDTIFLADFDRLLYWLAHFPDTLYAIIGQAALNLFNMPTVYGRTEAAMFTHPELQRRTETAIAAYFYANLFDTNYGQPAMDFLAGTYVLPRYAANFILNNSYAEGAGAVDVEWQALLHLGLRAVDVIQTDGLGFEGAWIGMEPEVTDAIAKKRSDNLKRSRAMVDTIKFWRQHDRSR